MDTTKGDSSALFKAAEKIIPGGVNSPVRSCKKVGTTPVYFTRAEGPYLWDVSEKRYTDFCLAFGPHLLGHSHPAVVEAILEQAPRATSFGANHPQEIEFAEWLLKGYPFLDKVRLVNSGTEAVMTAVRIARGFTGRNKILQFEGMYHGHSDGLLASAGSGVAELSTASSKGVPPSIVQETLVSHITDKQKTIGLFEKFGSEIAAVIIEPVAANYGLWWPTREYLAELVELAHRHGALVIFDEVISGFRLGLSGATGYFDLKPDLVTLGKIIGGGLPLAAIAGKQSVMDVLAPIGSVYQAGTLSGNPLAIAAGTAVLKELFVNPPYAVLAERCAQFCEKLRALGLMVKQQGSLFWIHFEASEAFPPNVSSHSQEKYRRLFMGLLNEGVYLAPSPYEVGFISTAHTDSVLEQALEGFKKACG